MTDSQQPASYYEIALTNRQVLVAFVILLVCLVAAFFSGVWVGRGGDLAPAPPPRVADAPAAAAGEQPDERRISFFEDEPGAGADTAGGAEPRAASPEPGREPDAPTEPERPAARAAEAAPEPAAAPASGAVIQVFSSTDRAQAQRLVDRLADGGYPAFLSPHEVRGRLMHRVRVGPYADEAEADAVAARIRQAFQLEETWVTSGG